MPSYPSQSFRPHRILPLLLASVIFMLSGCATGNPQDTFTTAGPVANDQATLFKIIFWIAVIVFILVEGALLFITFRFRRKSTDQIPVQTHGNAKLEIIWTIIPALVIAAIAIPTVFKIWDLNAPPKGQEPIYVEAIGHQWWFEFRYPGHEIVTANELVIPVDKPVVVKLLSPDVIHSFWVPSLAGKVDMVPLKENSLWFQADKTGSFFGQCAEFCGIAHAHMRFRVIAKSQEDFDSWVLDMATPPDNATANPEIKAGKTLFARNCSSCHTTDSYRPGGYQREISLQDGRWSSWLADIENASIVSAPNLTHFGLRSTLGAGIEELNRDTLITWITDPSKIKIGTRMQEHAKLYESADKTAKLTADEIANIADYLLALIPGENVEEDTTDKKGFQQTGEVAFESNGCVACHSTGTDTLVGPGLSGIGNRAGSRVDNLTPDEYLKQSLKEPSAYVVDGFTPAMPSFSYLGDDEIDKLIDYLKTLN